MPHIAGNVGFVFTKEDLNDIRDILTSNQKEAPAKAGAIAPVDVFVAKVNTGLGPEKTSFFQALAIPTKITKGTIEILVSFVAASAIYKKFVVRCNLFDNGMFECAILLCKRRKTFLEVNMLVTWLLPPLDVFA